MYGSHHNPTGFTVRVVKDSRNEGQKIKKSYIDHRKLGDELSEIDSNIHNVSQV